MIMKRQLISSCCGLWTLRDGTTTTAVFTMIVYLGRLFVHILPLKSKEVAGSLDDEINNPTEPSNNSPWLLLIILATVDGFMIISSILIFPANKQKDIDSSLKQGQRSGTLCFLPYLLIQPIAVLFETGANIYFYIHLHGRFQTSTLVGTSPVYLANMLIWLMSFPFLVMGYICVISRYGQIRGTRHDRQRTVYPWDQYAGTTPDRQTTSCQWQQYDNESFDDPGDYKSDFEPHHNRRTDRHITYTTGVNPSYDFDAFTYPPPRRHVVVPVHTTHCNTAPGNYNYCTHGNYRDFVSLQRPYRPYRRREDDGYIYGPLQRY